MRTLRRLEGGSLGTTNTLAEHLAYHYGADLTGLSFYVRDSVWGVVIKADFGNRAKVAFLTVGTFARAVEVCCEYCSNGWLTWKFDKKPPRTRRLRSGP